MNKKNNNLIFQKLTKFTLIVIKFVNFQINIEICKYSFFTFCYFYFWLTTFKWEFLSANALKPWALCICSF